MSTVVSTVDSTRQYGPLPERSMREDRKYCHITLYALILTKNILSSWHKLMLTDRVAIGAMAAGLLSSTIGFSFRQSLTKVLDPYENPRFSEILSPLPPHFNVDCFGELFSSWICVKKPSLQFIQH